jgi:hypothetical protein
MHGTTTKPYVCKMNGWFLGVFVAGLLWVAQSFGQATYQQDARIGELMNRFMHQQAERQTTDGFRVQLHFGNDREKAREVKVRFLQQFPEVPAYESYQQPNFRIRVGDFRSKLEANRFLKRVLPTFPAAFSVPEQIRLPILEPDR